MRRLMLAAALAASVTASTPAMAKSKDHDDRRAEPLVIAHRGASAYRPEHTLSAYRLAIGMGADYIEPDLVSTKDHKLVVRHENEISGTTDVASHPEFASRRTTKTIDGTALTGWFTEDFTLAELKTLRAVERLPDLRPTNTAFNGLFQIPTLQEVIDLAKREGVGIYPRPSTRPTSTRSASRSRSRWSRRCAPTAGTGRSSPVFIQSFEVSNLQELNRKIRVPLVQLTSASGRPYDFTAKGDPRTYADITSARGLREVAKYADGLGPDKNQVVPRDAQNRLLPPTSLIADAHRAGLVVHPYTFRPENSFLPEDFREGNPASPEYLRARGDQPAELALFYRLGVDGLFADNPDTAVAVRRRVFRR